MNRLCLKGRSASIACFGIALSQVTGHLLQPVDAKDVAFPNAVISDMHWVVVPDANNPPDTNGLGAVPHEFLIARYELTNDEYCRFLNGSQAGRKNLHGLSDGPLRPQMLQTAADFDRAITRAQQPNGEFFYAVVPPWGDKPVANLRWIDAARLANWLHNGGALDADTEQGAYNLGNAPQAAGQPRAAAKQALVWIPTHHEWYKAAYYQKKAKANAYSKYPTASDNKPQPIQRADNFGLGPEITPKKANSANFTRRSRWPEKPPPCCQIPREDWDDFGAVTSVGSNGRSSALGAFDMAGNAPEIVTVIRNDPMLITTCLMGGGVAVKDGISSADAEKDVTDAIAGRSPMNGGIRLACSMNHLVPIKAERAHAPLAKIHARLQSVDKCLSPLEKLRADAIEKGHIANVKAALRVEHPQNGDPNGALHALDKRIEGVIDALDQDITKRDQQLLGINANKRVLTPILAPILGPDLVDAAAGSDRDVVHGEFAEKYKVHKDEVAKLRKDLQAEMPANDAIPP